MGTIGQGGELLGPGDWCGRDIQTSSCLNGMRSHERLLIDFLSKNDLISTPEEDIDTERRREERKVSVLGAKCCTWFPADRASMSGKLVK